MKKLVIALLVGVMLLASTSMAFAADGDAEQGFENSPVFVPSGRGSYKNVHNELLRFDLDTGRTAIPGKAWKNANEHSVIYQHTDLYGSPQTLIDPLGSYD